MTTTVEAEEVNRETSNAALISALRAEDAGAGESTWDLEVINDTERGRWIAALGADAIAELTYRFVGGRVVLLSMWVDHAYRNRRVATELIHRVLDEIRATGKKITIICPVVGAFIARNPEYFTLVDSVHPGSGARPRTDTDAEQQATTFEHDVK